MTGKGEGKRYAEIKKVSLGKRLRKVQMSNQEPARKFGQNPGIVLPKKEILPN